MPGNRNNPSQRAMQQAQQNAHRHFQKFAAQQQKNLQDQWRAGHIARSAQAERERSQTAADGSRTTFPSGTGTREWVPAAALTLVVLALGAGLFLLISLPKHPQPHPHHTPAVITSHSGSPITNPSPSFSTSPISSPTTPKGTASPTPTKGTAPVPGVIGDSVPTAEQILAAAGFRAKIVFAPVPAGSPDFARVTAQDPGQGRQASAGDTVTITVGTIGASTSPPPPSGSPTPTGPAPTAPASMP